MKSRKKSRMIAKEENEEKEKENDDEEGTLPTSFLFPERKY
jgi:hypothetical protein